MGELYRLDFPSGKSYVGITTRSAMWRFVDHCGTARRRGQFAVHNAIQKYGADEVKVVTLAVGSWDYLCEAEVRAIKVFGTKSPRGYNLTDGGEGVVGNVMSAEAKVLLSTMNLGKKLSSSTKDAISATMTARMANPSVRENISTKLKGKVVSDETKMKLSIAAKRRYESPEERTLASTRSTGRKVSEETCAKLSKSLNAYYARRDSNAGG